VLSRTANDADRRLARLDRRAFERKLGQTRELAVISRYAQALADTLAKQGELLDELTSARAVLDERIDELERRAKLVDAAESVSLRAEVDSLDDNLQGALDRVAAEVGDLAERLHRTVHRGIFRQGDLWAVPYYDSRDAKRVRRFDDLDEARKFRDHQQLIEKVKIDEDERARERSPAQGDLDELTGGGGGVGWS
jgi:hypothetical protein